MPGRNFTDAEEEEIAKIYQAGHSAKAIMRAYGLNHHISICAALRRQGVEQRAAPERNRLYALNPHVFDVIDNEGAAYWWGFAYADGCVCRRTFSISLKYSDRMHLTRLGRFMESESPVNTIMANINDGQGTKRKHARIEFTDRHLVKRLRKLGMLPGRPAFHLVREHLPLLLANHWIRGLFDGDGSASKPNTRKPGAENIKFCGALEMMEWVLAQLAEHADINPNLAICKHTRSYIYYLTIGGRKQALKVADFLYQNATIWMPRKRKRTESWR